MRGIGSDGNEMDKIGWCFHPHPELVPRKVWLGLGQKTTAKILKSDLKYLHYGNWRAVMSTDMTARVTFVITS